MVAAVGEDGFHSRAVELGDRMKRGSGRRRGRTGLWGVCVHGILNKLPKEIKSPSSARLQYHLLGYSSKLSKDASPVFFFFSL